jgi:geranylgeranyl diphosphate synthase type II
MRSGSAFSDNFPLEDYLREKCACIDQSLERYLSRYPAGQQTIFRAIRYGIFPGGKRIRPILTLAAGELFDAPADRLMPFACAIEMIHAYSLIHDDLPELDDDDVRRGEPSTHRVFGPGMALLAGDGLLTEAFSLMSDAEHSAHVSSAEVLHVIHEIAQAAGVMGLVGGQALDLEAESQDADLAMVEVIHVRKTGALILAAIRIGARLAGAGDSDLVRVGRFGEYLGLAFQVADDILDARSETSNDRLESSLKEQKKATYPAVVGIVQARERLDELSRLALAELEFFGARAAALAALTRHVCGRALPTHP